jgi:hypothetical protein
LALVLLDVNATLPLRQNVDAPAGEIVGIAGIGFTVTVVAVEGELLQPLEVTVLV